MAVKGIERVRRNFGTVIRGIDGTRTEAAVYAVLSQGAALAQTMTPMDTSNLINSQYAPQISHQQGKTSGQVGYTAAYAAAVHSAPGTLKGLPRADFGRTSNRSDMGPMRPRSFGGGSHQGRYWDPNAEPQFLTKGFDQLMPSIPAILEGIYRV